MLRFPNAMKLESFSKGRLELVEYRLPEDTILNGIRLSDLYKNLRVRVLICAVARKGETIIPSGDFELRSGDKIYLTSSPAQLEQFFRHLRVFRCRASSVMIVGASKMCYYLAQELLEMGMSVKIIDRDENRCIQMGERLPRALVIVGDGTDSELLQEEGIGQTDAFVAITGMDEANILMSMSASKQAGECKVVGQDQPQGAGGSGLRREHDRQRGFRRRRDGRADPPVCSGHAKRHRLPDQDPAPHCGWNGGGAGIWRDP